MIYFASAEQLNDPMEGLRDIFWCGDKIVWTNLFKNYVYCLHRTYLNVKIFGDDFKLSPEFIPVWGRWDQPETPEIDKLFNVGWDRISQDTGLNGMIDNIVKAKRKARVNEILFYLSSFHVKALAMIQNIHVEQGLAPKEERNQFDSLYKPMVLSDSQFFELLPQLEKEYDNFSEVTSSITNGMSGDLYLAHKYFRRNTTTKNLEQNRQLLIFDFPRFYLDQIQRILWPRWYAACFTKNYQNSSLWGNYGDEHRGVCLIFEDEETGVLSLNQVTGWSFSRSDTEEKTREHWNFAPMTFHDVSYAGQVGEVDFFQSIGRLPLPILMKLWYTDKDGNISECASQAMKNEADEEHWQKKYWDNFIRDITVKTRDWEYERESRLILYGLLDDELEEHRRKLTYDFNSLKGIIFGIRTLDEHKVKIIEIIEKKCRDEGRTEFKFFQAYYSPKDGDIRRREIKLSFSGINDSSDDVS